MQHSSRGLRESVVRALAKVGLVWAVAVLGGLFMAMSALGQYGDGAYALATSSLSSDASGAPSTLGLALAVLVLAGGLGILLIGALRSDRVEVHRLPEPESPTSPAIESDLTWALALGLLPAEPSPEAA